MKITISTLFVLSFTFLLVVKGYTQNKLPNIVIILADDLGYGSVGAYGASKDILKTPAIDKLAEDGRKFSRAYTPSSVCSPTRYGLLTGQYQWQEGAKYGTTGAKSPLSIDTNRPTIASRLQDLGYNTAAIGKWHLGYQKNKSTDYTKKLSPGPLDLGFDYHWGIPSNNGDVTGIWVENEYPFGLVDRMENLLVEQRQPDVNWQGKKMLGIPAPFRKGTETADTLNDQIDKWIDGQSKEEPFFLYYPMPAIHSPHTPSPAFVGKSNLGAYGDFIMELDNSVNTVIEALDRNGFTENTLVIFTSDNGGHPAGATKEIRKTGFKINGDLKGTKLTVFEGGFRVPFIAKWPGKISEGSTSNELVNLVDIYATVIDIVNEKMGNPQKEAGDSYSFYPALFGTPKTPIRDHMIYTSYEGIVSIQVDRWKYIEGVINDPNPRFMKGDKHPRRLAEAHEQLYNLNVDTNETNNIFESNTARVNEIKNRIDKIRRQGYSR